MREERPNAISKILSRNDTGETGGHQAGILVPKTPEILSFFPSLDSSQKNPRHMLFFTDECHEKWTFSFIYYNNKFFDGTRNEFRLTRMIPFFKRHNLVAGDTLQLTRNQTGSYSISYSREKNETATEDDGIIRLGSSWKVIRI